METDIGNLIIQLVTLVLAVSVAFGMAFWARRAQHDRSAYVGLYLLFGIPGGLLFVAGLALVVNGNVGGWLPLGLGLGFSLPLIKPFRQAVAKVTPMDPDSPIDFSGLAIILALIAFFLVPGITQAGAVTVDPEEVPEVGYLDLIINGLTFVAMAFAAVGYLNWRGWPDALRRLGVFTPSLQTVLIALALVIPAFIMAIIGSMLTVAFQPDAAASVDDAMEAMTGQLLTPFGALMLGVTSGVGEELLFRGAIQPRFGILLTSVLFTVVHAQYEFSFVLLGLFGSSILFGLERKYLGTVAAMITHGAYNFMVVMLQVVLVNAS